MYLSTSSRWGWSLTAHFLSNSGTVLRPDYFLERKLKHLHSALSHHTFVYRGALAFSLQLEPQNLQELTSTAGPEVLEAMNAFVYRLIGARRNVRFACEGRLTRHVAGRSVREHGRVGCGAAALGGGHRTPCSTRRLCMAVTCW